MLKARHFQTLILVVYCCFSFFLTKEILSKPASSFSMTMEVIEKEIEDIREESLSKHCICGEENVPLSSRIIGGEDVNLPGKYPWMVALIAKKGIMKYTFFCGGALISTRYVLTAAHCIDFAIYTNDTSRIRIILGSQKLPLIAQNLKGSKFIVHPNYGEEGVNNDIGLIKLAKSVKFTDYIRPICLPKREKDMQATTAVVTGWGHTNQKYVWPREQFFAMVHELFSNEPTLKETKTLKEVSVPVVPIEICKQNYKGIDDIADSMMCAGEEAKGVCHGDSGSALISNYNERWYEIGIVSFGQGCGLGRFPAVYTRISHFLDWIYNNTKDSRPCQPE